MSERPIGVGPVDAFFDAVEAGDWDRVTSLFSSTATAVMLHAPNQPLRLDPESFVEMWRGGNRPWGDHEFVVEEVLGEDPYVTLQVTFRATQDEPILGIEPSGERFEMREVHVFRVDHGCIMEYRLLSDVAQNYRELGILEDGLDWKLRREHYRVLARILRHNLRNDLTKVAGFADLLSTDAADPETYGDRIRSVSGDLVDTGEKARTVEELVVEGEVSTEPVEVDRILRSVAEDHPGDGRRGEVTVHATTGRSVRSDPEILRAVLDELVGNALEHVRRPTVELSARPVGDTVEVTVADDGPGIPEGELAPVREGTETDLSHGSGVGLWLVKWGSERLGADLRFDVGDRGTVVTLALPEQ